MPRRWRLALLVTLVLKFAVFTYWLRHLSWGTIDDAYHWELAHMPLPFFEHLRQLIELDLKAGMFRPVYNLYMMFGYRAFETSPVIFYTLNALALLIAVFATAKLWLRATVPSQSTYQPDFTVIAGALIASLFAFDPWTKLFVHLSLQEKLGIILFPFLLSALLQARPGIRQWISILLFSALILLSKATFISFGPPLILLLLLTKPAHWKRSVFTLVLVFGAAGIGFLNLRQGYTAQYSPSLTNFMLNLPKTDLTVTGVWVVSFASVGMALLAALQRKGALSRALKIACIGTFGIASVSAVVVPWASGDYYLSPLVPWWIAVLAGIASRMSQYRIRLALFCALLIAIGGIGMRFNLWPKIDRNREMAQVTMLIKKARKAHTHSIAFLDSCAESRDSLNLFSDPAFPVVTTPMVYFVRTTKHMTSGEKHLWIDGGAPCPVAEAAPPADKRHYLLEGEHWTVFEAVPTPSGSL